MGAASEGKDKRDLGERVGSSGRVKKNAGNLCIIRSSEKGIRPETQSSSSK